MRKVIDWSLFVFWIVYIAAVGPWLISADDWGLVFFGLGLLAFLAFATLSRVISFLQRSPS